MAKTIQELTNDLLAAPSACKEIKAAATAYLDSIGTEKEADAAKAYVAVLEADIMPIDGLISFAESDMGRKVFGIDGAKKKDEYHDPDGIRTIRFSPSFSTVVNTGTCFFRNMCIIG